MDSGERWRLVNSTVGEPVAGLWDPGICQDPDECVERHISSLIEVLRDVRAVVRDAKVVVDALCVEVPGPSAARSAFETLDRVARGSMLLMSLATGECLLCGSDEGSGTAPDFDALMADRDSARASLADVYERIGVAKVRSEYLAMMRAAERRGGEIEDLLGRLRKASHFLSVNGHFSTGAT